MIEERGRKEASGASSPRPSSKTSKRSKTSGASTPRVRSFSLPLARSPVPAAVKAHEQAPVVKPHKVDKPLSSARSKSVGARSGNSFRRSATDMSKTSHASTERKSAAGAKRAGQLRRRIHELAKELEQIERSSNISSSMSGFQITLNESHREAHQYKNMLTDALREVKVQRNARASLVDEVDRLNEQLTRVRMESRKHSKEVRDIGVVQPPEIQLVHLRGELAQERREKEAYRMKFEALVTQQRDTSPPRHPMQIPRVRDGMKRIELEARCATLEQMVKGHEQARGQLLLPNTVRAILQDHDLDPGLQDDVMRDVHDYLNGQRANERRPRLPSPGASPYRSLRSRGSSPAATSLQSEARTPECVAVRLPVGLVP